MNHIECVSIDLVSKYCENLFFRSPGSDVLLVFLPSVNGKSVYPYFPRKSWADALAKKYNVLYISDPYQPLPQYKESMGSWFISPDGKLTLEVLAKALVEVKKNIGAREIVLYGSSMGGYAALILASLIDGSKAIAECPQIYLKNHPGSRYVCEKLLDPSISFESKEPLAYLQSGGEAHLRIICSMFDSHYSQHVLPFIKDIEEKFDELSCSVTLYAYMNAEYKRGHVAMSKKDACNVIDEVVRL